MSAGADETRAVAFLALLLTLSVGARIAAAPDPPEIQAAAVDVDSLSAESLAALEADLRRRQPLAPGERIDPNRAPAGELARLPGVGPAVAGRIVESREREGAFGTTGDLLRIAGVGERTLARIQPHLDIPEGPPTAGGPGPPTPGAPAARFPPAPGIPVAHGSASRGSVAGVDPNTATAAQLATLPGIGPALAARIIQHREVAGPFRRAADLEAVAGIGPAKRERLEPMLLLPP